MRLFTRDSLERMGVTTRSVQSERRPRVKLHRNAKTTPHMRALIVQRIRHEQWPPADGGGRGGHQRAHGVQVAARGTAWAARPALEDRVLAAASAAAADGAGGRRPRIVAARHERRTAWAIAVRLQVPRSTVAAVLARAGLNRLGAPDAAGAGHPLRTDASRRAGASRYQTARAHSPRRPPHSWRSPRAASRASAGSTRMSPSMTTAVPPTSRSWPIKRGAHDGGLPAPHRRLVCAPRRPHRARPDRQRRRLSQSALSGGGRARTRVRLKRTRPYRPQTNGKAERFIQTLIREWAYARAVPQLAGAARARCAHGSAHYNVVRPHAALGYQPPCSRFPRVAQ